MRLEAKMNETFTERYTHDTDTGRKTQTQLISALESFCGAVTILE